MAKLIDMSHNPMSRLGLPVIVLMGSISVAARPERVLIVSKNSEQCPDAEFSTIQDAVNAASAADTILICSGMYQEMVLISGEDKNNLQIRPRSGADSVVLDGMNHTLEAGFLLQDVSGVVIEGFTAQGFREANIWLRAADNNVVSRNALTGSGHDGIQLLNSSGNIVEDNQSFDHPASNACGINVVGAGSRGNLLRHNLLQNDNWGIQVVGGAIGNVLFENRSIANRDRGIRTVSATGTVINQNQTEDNPMGIAVVSSTEVKVARNHSFGNTEFDLFWDGQGSVTFTDNHCKTSSPDGLCGS